MFYKRFLLLLLFTASSTVVFAQNTVVSGTVTDAKTYYLLSYATVLPITNAMGNKPNVEGSVGIENIFKFIRVDLVKRFDYLDNSNVAEWGIRTRVDFNF